MFKFTNERTFLEKTYFCFRISEKMNLFYFSICRYYFIDFLREDRIYCNFWNKKCKAQKTKSIKI